MAKELPYFKFEPNQWENGNIQMFNRDIKGLFVDLCSVYWSRLGELPYALALQKHCNGSNEALQMLEDAQIIQVVDSQIIIEFLDEQLNEFANTSEKRRNAANKRWSDASALQKQSKSNAIREEERKEDKTKLKYESELYQFTENFYLRFKELEISMQYPKNPKADSLVKNIYDLTKMETPTGVLTLEQIGNGLDYYLANIEDKYIPTIRSTKAFKEKYFAIIEHYKRTQNAKPS